MSVARIVASIALFSTIASSARAQCADGSSLPCGKTQPARSPPIADNRWIVLPFTNTARTPGLDWLGNASVGLLSKDMSRWTNITIVSDERVIDLMRDTPESRRTQLGLADALAIAKRVGAGRLVIGDYFKEGTRTTVTAKVYNVRTGERIRAPSQRVSSTDSISAAYERLVPLVLDLPTPLGTTLAGIGTTSTDAIQAYSLGMRALARYRRDSAAIYFRQAVRFDSTFALALFRLAGTINAAGPQVSYPGGVDSIRAAVARYAASLPVREQLVIGRLTNCEKGARLLALDSADAEGWLAINACYSGNNRLAVSGDGRTYRLVSLNSAWNAGTRALELQPNWIAVARLQLLRTPITFGCTVAAMPCPTVSRYWAALVWEGDSVATHFEPVRPFDPPERRREAAAGRRAALDAARRFLQSWSAANPQNLIAHGTYADFLAQLGDLAGAERELTAAAEFGKLNSDERNREIYDGYRAEVQWKLGNAERAATILDSTPATQRNDLHAAFGRFSRGKGTSDTSWRALAASFNEVFAGVVPPDFEKTMRAFADADTAWRADILEVGTALAYHALRRRAATDTASEFSLFRFQAWLTLADTARARRALVEYDAWGDMRSDTYMDGYEMFAAESWLELGDTATAWARIEPFARRWPGFDLNHGAMWNPTETQNIRPAVQIAGRAWLLYADLAMATGHVAEAKRGYRMITGMWENGEAPVQPLVKRAREALAKLGGS